jgi:dihydroflavonol-4-reductase
MGLQGLSLVTGGFGFIGRHLVQALINRGQAVRVLDINPNPGILKNAADVWTGSIHDKDLLYNAMQGVTVVYHLAAIPHLWSLNPDAFDQVNTKGTESVLEVCEHFELSRFVYTSSETVLRPWRNHSDRLIDESQPLPQPEELPGPYSKSKLQAEKAVEAAIKQGLPGVIVYPTIPIGAGDINLTPPTRMIRDFLTGKTLAHMECNLNLIPVQAVAEGHILAAEAGTVGERYILGQDNFKMSELLSLIERQLGKKMPKRKVSYAVAMATAQVMEFTARFSKKVPQASIEGVRLAGAHMIFDCSKARKELSVPEYSIPQALKETAEWLKEQGHLEK